ncbi:acyltransferase [Alkanindiges hydrocarboniclasticus]|jgi:1-acyl-sn-glycerol-3-phosphate acyltransferase|uniref:Acyltransferase n=1 Tax=Alkanindiges hydrocarboniclasticus TaxID=1907941 RepID=A0A1S8CY61_9GAMM|nr:1-acyl-sn-glycerol-3-phosphate acyltransferase [Alkanindiges hydrocarboniclasticus]ONG42287.1 acyltransferase [Alkanindiges hydrocarboniclasticus]
MLKQLGKATFKLYGWTYQYDPALLSDKQVAIGFEHTSNRDAILSLALFQIMGLKIHTLIKKELFKGPLKPLLEALGGIPVDRNASKNIVTQMAQQFADHEKFTLVIAPEATRAKDGETRKPIRTGFWHIAKAANVPIVLMFSDVKTKHGGLLGKIMPTDLESDLLEIQRYYRTVGIEVLIPERK